MSFLEGGQPVEFVWPMLLLVALTFLGAQRLRGYIGEVRERAELDDDTRHAEQLTLMLAVESLVGRSVRYSVSFGPGKLSSSATFSHIASKMGF